MTDLHAHIVDVETKLKEWDARLDALEHVARQSLVRGERGAEAEIKLLEDLRRQHKAIGIRLRALRIVREDRWEGPTIKPSARNHMFEEDFVMDEIRRAPD